MVTSFACIRMRKVALEVRTVLLRSRVDMPPLFTDQRSPEGVDAERSITNQGFREL